MEGLTMKYFSLKPKGIDAYAEASRRAMVMYADAIYDENPVLANDLINWAAREELAAKEG